MQPLQSHPLRRALIDEAHARPHAAIATPSRITSLSLVFDRNGASAQFDALCQLAAALGLPAPEAGCAFYCAEHDGLQVRWLLHTEFARYTFIEAGPSADPFEMPALARIPDDWLGSLPGSLLTALHAAVLAGQDDEAPAAEIARRWFAGNELIGAEIGEGQALAYTDLKLHPDPRLAEGFSRYLVINRGMGPNQTGRMLQRLFEVETYRMLALLALPIAKRQMGELDTLGTALRGITGEMAGEGGRSDGALLGELTRLAMQVETLVAESQYRFTAARAYYQLVERRITELRESRLPGLQPFREFMERRLAPAMATCDTVAQRQDRLTGRLQRATLLLRTRVEVQHEEQNRALLASMDRRAGLQLRLQETVEGLSVGVLTYYLVGLLGYLLKAAKAAGLHLNVELATGVAIPVVAVGVWWGVERLRRSLAGHG